MIRPIPGIDYAALVMTGQKPFPTFNKERKGEGFKEVLDKEMEKVKKNESSYKVLPSMWCKDG